MARHLLIELAIGQSGSTRRGVVSSSRVAALPHYRV